MSQYKQSNGETANGCNSDKRIPRENWKKLSKKSEESGIILNIPGRKETTGKKEFKGGAGEDSVFKLAIQGLDSLSEKGYSDMDIMTASIAMAEGQGAFSTGERETVVVLKSGAKSREMTISENEAKVIKLVTTFLLDQKMVENIPEDRYYKAVDHSIASTIGFLSGQSAQKRLADKDRGKGKGPIGKPP